MTEEEMKQHIEYLEDRILGLEKINEELYNRIDLLTKQPSKDYSFLPTPRYYGIMGKDWGT